MRDLTICDMHCDTATKLYDNNIDLDLSTIANTQFFAVFISPRYYKNPKERFFNVINHMYNEFLILEYYDY